MVISKVTSPFTIAPASRAINTAIAKLIAVETPLVNMVCIICFNLKHSISALYKPKNKLFERFSDFRANA